MQLKFHMPTKAYFGKDCIAQNSNELSGYGDKALIVTGGRSAQLSGALHDVCDALERLSIEYDVFSKIENNPSEETVKEGGIAVKQAGSDFVIGIGGGSPLDAAKAIAVLATNDIEPEQLYTNKFPQKPLPIIAIPTTAGTGSEVTPYSILTRKDLQTKKSFGTQETFPAIAFLDPRYTESQPLEVTVNTAIDALSHNIEGYLGKRSMPVSDLLAQEGIRLFGVCIDCLRRGNLSYEEREKLLYMSMLGGMVISHTGTTIVHAAGYNYTYFKNIPHGRANGYLLAEYLRFNYDFSKDKTDNVLRLMGLNSIDAFDEVITSLIGRAPKLEEEEIIRYAEITMTQRSVSANIRPVQREDMEEFLRRI